MNKKQFELVFRDGLRASSPLFRISTLTGEGALGITTTKKIGCHARRNRQKRRTREAWNQIQSPSTLKLDVVIVANASTQDSSFEVLRNELQRLQRELEERWAERLASG
ncbi:MAG: ribonuclease P protein component [Armatimonadetes bacterium]|nr:ribonuclease P protein component [Armatimonadota bacterium]